MSLELRAMRWLRWDKKVWGVLMERTPRHQMGTPDVLGITQARYLIEIEIKRTLSDFRADADKTHRANREVVSVFSGLPLARLLPKQIYYLVPEALTPKVLPELPDWAGLMDDSQNWVKVIKVAPNNGQSKKLSILECCRLVTLMANNLISEMDSRECVQSRLFPEKCYYDFWPFNPEI